jgi:hypothetical protein
MCRTNKTQKGEDLNSMKSTKNLFLTALTLAALSAGAWAEDREPGRLPMPAANCGVPHLRRLPLRHPHLRRPPSPESTGEPRQRHQHYPWADSSKLRLCGVRENSEPISRPPSIR